MSFLHFGISLVLIVGFLGEIQASEPADRSIKSAISDLSRFEEQFSGAGNPSASSIKRNMKLLSITRQRLDSSPNKSHESWIEADQRYRNLLIHMQSVLDNKSSPTGQIRNWTDKTETISQ